MEELLKESGILFDFLPYIVLLFLIKNFFLSWKIGDISNFIQKQTKIMEEISKNLENINKSLEKNNINK